MKYRTHNDANLDASGTSLKGYVRDNVTFDDIVNAFGEPEEGFDKTQYEWTIKFSDGKIATIYDWKNYYGDAKRLTGSSWHIGGKNPVVVDRINSIL